MASLDGLEREELEGEVVRLREALEERENEVIKAGLFGKELLQHNTALQSQVEELKERSVSIDEYNELKEAQTILLQKLAEMREKLRETEKKTDVEEGGEVDLKEELEREQMRVMVEKEKQKQMTKDFRELEGRLVAQIEEAKRHGEEEGVRIREEERAKALVLQRENEALRQEGTKVAEDFGEVKTGRKEAEVKLKKFREENQELREQTKKLKMEMQELQEKQDILGNKRENEVKEAREEAEKMKAECMAARLEGRKLQQRSVALVEENQRLLRDQEENQAVLDEAKEKIRKMQVAMDENKVSNNTTHSAIWELEKGLNTLISKKNASPEKTETENSPKPKESSSPSQPSSPSTTSTPTSSPPPSSPPTPHKTSPSRSSPSTSRPKPKPKPKPTSTPKSSPSPSPPPSKATPKPKPKPKPTSSAPKSGPKPTTPKSTTSKPATPKSTTPKPATPKASSGAKPKPKAKPVVKKTRKEASEEGGQGMLLEEYFHLAASAVKITMATAHPHASDALLKISSNSLFEECVAQDIPFHIWHDWIHSTLLGLLNLDKKTDQK